MKVTPMSVLGNPDARALGVTVGFIWLGPQEFVPRPTSVDSARKDLHGCQRFELQPQTAIVGVRSSVVARMTARIHGVALSHSWELRCWRIVTLAVTCTGWIIVSGCSHCEARTAH